MDKAEHAKRLRQAIATSSKFDRHHVAAAVDKGYRTVSNWVSETKPMMPSDADRAILRRMFPGYDSPGDPVEVALDQSELVEWRRDMVKGTYKKHLHEQRGEVAG